METLAGKMRKELSNEFENIREELDDYVCGQIRFSGQAYIGKAGRYDTLIETEKYGIHRGIKKINQRLFDAAKMHYTNQGFRVTLDYSPMGTILRGFYVSLV